MNPVLLDTGFIVATLDKSEHHHRVCLQTAEEIRRPLVTCEAVIVEACYLLRGLPGAATAILENVASEVFRIPFLLSRDSRGVQKLLQKYSDRDIDLADACLIHLAGELRTGDILSLDSDFDVYRWGSNKPFRRLIR